MDAEKIKPEPSSETTESERTIVGFLKEVYSPSSYIFLGINIVSLIIIYFVLSKAMGGIGIKTFAYIFCIVVGGIFGVRWSIKKNGDAVTYFRSGAGTLLVIFTLLVWMNDGYKSPYSTGYSATSHTCLQCGKNYSGNGWMTVGGDQYQPDGDNGDQYCSKSCAYESQPSKWKR